MRVFDIDYMKRIEILEIGNNCLKKVSKFELEGFDELRSVSVGTNSFYLDKKNREGSKCVIINCNQLRELTFGMWSFYCYESLILKNLPSLQYIHLNIYSFVWFHSAVFQSKRIE